jgi:hypothetical protein
METAAANIPPSVKLFNNSLAAALSAIEIYNKPDFKHREEIFSILIINAWELILKAKIVSDANESLESIYIYDNKGQVKRNRTKQPLTLDVTAALKTVGTDATIAENLEILISIRDSAVHLYATESLSYLLYTLGAATLRNYQNFANENFGRSLREFDFYILPLAFAYNFQTLAAIDVEKEPELVALLLKSVASSQLAAGPANYQLVCEVGVELRSAKKFIANEADLSVTVGPTADAAVVYRTQPLTDRYPLSYFELVGRVKANLPGTKQSALGDHPKPAIDDQVKSGHREKA